MGFCYAVYVYCLDLFVKIIKTGYKEKKTIKQTRNHSVWVSKGIQLIMTKAAYKEFKQHNDDLSGECLEYIGTAIL